MSSKSKLTKFKNAVAASSFPSSSHPPSSKPSTTSLTTTQANMLQALHQEQLARLASITLPKLAAAHSRRFLHLARSQTQTADAMWSTQKLQAVHYRKSLWAEDVEPEPAVEGEARIVPDFYHKHNGRCARCALPLVPGLNQVTLRKAAKHSKTKTKGRTAKRTSSCTLCHHKIR